MTSVVEKLKLKVIDGKKYIFLNKGGEEISLMIYGSKAFKEFLKDGVVGMATHNGTWLNIFELIVDSKDKAIPEEKTKPIKVISPFDEKSDTILAQCVLKASIELVKMDCPSDSPISPNRRIGLTKHYVTELYHFMKNKEYKELDNKFIDGDEVIKND